MSCNLCNTFKTTDISIVGNNLVLTISPFTFTNLDEYNCIICQNIPNGSGNLKVQIKNGTSNIDVKTRKGNYFLGKYLKCRSVLKLWFSDNPVCFTAVNFINVENNSCNSCSCSISSNSVIAEDKTNKDKTNKNNGNDKNVGNAKENEIKE